MTVNIDPSFDRFHLLQVSFHTGDALLNDIEGDGCIRAKASQLAVLKLW